MSKDEEITHLRETNASLRIANAKLQQRVNSLLRILHKVGEYANLELEQEVQHVDAKARQL